MIFAETGFYKHLSRFNFKRDRQGLSFYKSTLSMCAPKIEAAPVAGQALLPKKTLRRKVSLVKHHVRWANVCQGKANDDAIFALSSLAVSKPVGKYVGVPLVVDSVFQVVAQPSR